MRKVEVRSNIVGDIMKIRKGVVYNEYATVVDELLQNCQRAKASVIQVVCQTGEDSLNVRDDGVGCQDPQDLFEKNTSAWGNEDEAFGEGFFSVFLLADYVYVRSANWELSLDVLKMLETRNMEIAVTEGLAYRQGMEVHLTGTAISNNGAYLRREVRKLGEIMDQDLTLNGEFIRKKPVLEAQAVAEALYEQPSFEAMLQPSRGYSTVSMFYENRPVTDEYVPYTAGRMTIRKGCVTLKAPDRKSFIYDEKRRKLFDEIAAAGAEMYRGFIVTATDEDIDLYEEGIAHYLQVEDYAQYLNVSEKLFRPDTDEEETVVNAGVMDVSEFLKMMKKMSPPEEEPTLNWAGEEIPRPRKKGMLELLTKKEKMLAYVPSGGAELYEKLIKRAEYARFVLVYSKNKLYDAALAYYGVPSIANLNDVVTEDFLIENTDPRSKKEERFLHLMEMVEAHYKMNPGSIRLANLSKVVKKKSTGEVLARPGESIGGLCDHKWQAVYIDRSIVKFPEYRAQTPEYPQVTGHDYRVLLRVSQTLSHELAHLLYGLDDNTVEHSNAMVVIGREIADLF